MNTPKNNAAVRLAAPVYGTVSPRMLRLIRALVRGPLTRENADRETKCSNSPDLVYRMRPQFGLGPDDLVCTPYKVIDSDGVETWPGRYSLTSSGHAIFTDWLNSVVMAADEKAK